MSDLISRQAALDCFTATKLKKFDFILYAREEIKKLPPVNLQEPKTGHWIVDRDDSRRWDKVRFVCSECGSWQTYGKTDYCPSCGARMVEPQESEE